MGSVKRSEIYVVTFAFVLSLLERAIALVSLGHSVDDLVYWDVPRFDYASVEDVAISQGRFVHPALAQVADILGVNAPRAFTLSGLVLSLCLALSAGLICRIWRIESDWRLSAIAAALFVAHPYFTDFFLWKSWTLTGGLPFAAALGALLLARQSSRRAVLAAVIVVLALGTYQVPLAVCGAVLAFAVLFDCVRGAPTPGARERMVSENVQMTGALVGGAVVYVLCAKAIIAVHGESDAILKLHRGDVVLFGHAGLVLGRARELFRVMTLDDPLVAPVLRGAFAVMVVLACAQIAVLIRHRGRGSVRHAATIALPLVVLVAAACAVALTAVSVYWQPSFRTLSAISVVWAGVAVALYSTGSRIVRRASLIVVGGIVLGFVGKSNEMLTDQLRASERDRALMTRIASDLEGEVPPASLDSVVFIGTNPSPIAGLSTAADISTGSSSYGTTLSVFASWFGEQKYLLRLFREITGYREISSELRPEDYTLGKTHCRNHSAWPGQGAIALERFGGRRVALICLSRPVRIARTRFDFTS